MEEYLIFVAIGGLLFLTLMVNSVSEMHEQKQREKRVRILKIKQVMTELSELLESLKSCDIPNAVRELLLNEILARLQKIQSIDKHFQGLQALFDEASAHDKQPSSVIENSNFFIKDDVDFKKKLKLLRHLLQVLNSNKWYTSVTSEQLHQYTQELKLLRCEKIFQFNSDKSAKEIEQKNLLLAKEHYYYIIHALKQSGVADNPRVIELIEQSEFMLNEISNMISGNIQKIVNEGRYDETQENETAAEHVIDAEKSDVEKTQIGQ